MDGPADRSSAPDDPKTVADPSTEPAAAPDAVDFPHEGRHERPNASPDQDADPDATTALAIPATRTPALASPLPPLTTAPMSVDRTPRFAAGGPAILSTLNYTLRKTGLLRGIRVLRQVNQSEGFDCPGCAWPEPKQRAAVEFCENGARAVADEATRRRATPELFAAYTIAELAERSDHWLNAQGRLTEPMLRRRGAEGYEPVSWDEAFTLIADQLRDLTDRDRAVFYTSGRTSNEAAFLYQLFVRAFGTNNLPDCSNMCHESTSFAMAEVIGLGKATVQLEDFERAEAIFIFGHNPGSNHPRMLATLRAAKLRGAKIVVVNPLREVGLSRFKHPQKLGDLVGRGVELADLHLPVAINGDVALMQALMKAVLEAGAVDEGFIAEHTRGFAALRAQLEARSWEELVAACGVPEDQLRAAADIYIASQATIVCWGMGLTQHENGVANVQAAINLLLLRGNLGKPGAGACPVRGHSNVQGDRTMGIWERPSSAFLDRLEAAIGGGFKAPREHGYDVVAAIEAMAAGKVDLFFALGGNFLSASPDTLACAEALRRCQLTVHVSTKLNRSHLVTGEQALILPCLGRTELDVQAGGPQFVSVEDGMCVVHRSAGRLPPASGQLLSEPMIVARLAAAVLGEREPVDWLELVADYDRIRELIGRSIPGHEDYNRRVRSEHGFVLPHPAAERRWPTASGKAELTTHELPARKLDDGQFLMMTVRAHDQYNTTIYENADRYRGINGYRRLVLMNLADMRRLEIEPYEQVDLTSHHAGRQRSAPKWVAVPHEIPPRMLATYFPEANVLVPLDQIAAGSRTPASKSVVVTVSRRSDD